MSSLNEEVWSLSLATVEFICYNAKIFNSKSTTCVWGNK